MDSSACGSHSRVRSRNSVSRASLVCFLARIQAFCIQSCRPVSHLTRFVAVASRRTRGAGPAVYSVGNGAIPIVQIPLVNRVFSRAAISTDDRRDFYRAPFKIRYCPEFRCRRHQEERVPPDLKWKSSRRSRERPTRSNEIRIDEVDSMEQKRGKWGWLFEV